MPKAATWGVLEKKVFLEISQNSQENSCATDSFLIKSLEQVLSCEFWEISKNTLFYRTPQDDILSKPNVWKYFVDVFFYNFKVLKLKTSIADS